MGELLADSVINVKQCAHIAVRSLFQ